MFPFAFRKHETRSRLPFETRGNLSEDTCEGRYQARDVSPGILPALRHGSQIKFGMGGEQSGGPWPTGMGVGGIGYLCFALVKLSFT